MTTSQKIQQYIEKHAHFKTEINMLREILNETELIEEVKWGAPSYTFNGKILLGLGAFKNHLGLWFHQGVFLKDDKKKLLNAQEGKTKALRQWRFHKGDVIEKEIIRNYIQETIENCLAGKEVKAVKAKVSMPLHLLLKEALERDDSFEKAYKALTPGKQREYNEYIHEAKREATQHNRMEKIKPMILAGQGLHDKYKNC